jgi:membrane fusion protein, multidrug efflux system
MTTRPCLSFPTVVRLGWSTSFGWSAVWAWCALLGAAGALQAAGPIRVDSVLVTLIEQVDVPASDEGVLTSIAVREGQVVSEGTLLAQLEDGEARETVRRAQLELDIATKEARNSLKVRFARKSSEVAQAELKRATDSVEKYRKSVSQSELDSLRLTAEGAVLEVEQAEHDLEIAQLTSQLKENELQVAVGRLERRKLLAPIAGVVVQIKFHRGEWLEPGEAVIRLLRIDRLRAEGFLPAREAVEGLAGRPVTLFVDLAGKSQARFPGKLVFISPEVNPVNGQVRIWAEIENRDLSLKPGLQASLSIDDHGAEHQEH